MLVIFNSVFQKLAAVTLALEALVSKHEKAPIRSFQFIFAAFV
jgi:hypothetical protein